MHHRVECSNCQAHRDRALPDTVRCFVCGSYRYRPVPLNAHDRAAIADPLHQATDGASE